MTNLDNPNICVYCGCDLTKEGVFFGAGDGMGQKFQCARCWGGDEEEDEL